MLAVTQHQINQLLQASQGSRMGDSKALEAAYADALEHEKIWATKRETLMEQLVVENLAISMDTQCTMQDGGGDDAGAEEAVDPAVAFATVR